MRRDASVFPHLSDALALDHRSCDLLRLVARLELVLLCNVDRIVVKFEVCVFNLRPASNFAKNLPVGCVPARSLVGVGRLLLKIVNFFVRHRTKFKNYTD